MTETLRHTTRNESFRLKGYVEDRETTIDEAFEIARDQFDAGASEVKITKGANYAAYDDDTFVIGVYANFSSGFNKPVKFGSSGSN